MIDDFQYNQNFEIVYEFIKTYGDLLENVSIKLIDKTSIKSNHYWMMAFFPKLKNLKQFTIFNENNSCNADGYKFLNKSMEYLKKNGGNLLKY
jgi:hypothetical protein